MRVGMSRDGFGNDAIILYGIRNIRNTLWTPVFGLKTGFFVSFVICFVFRVDSNFTQYENAEHAEKNVFQVLQNYENQNIPPFAGP